MQNNLSSIETLPRFNRNKAFLKPTARTKASTLDLLDSAPVNNKIGSKKKPFKFAHAPTLTCSPSPQLSALFFVAPRNPYKKLLMYFVLWPASSKFQMFDAGMGCSAASSTVFNTEYIYRVYHCSCYLCPVNRVALNRMFR